MCFFSLPLLFSIQTNQCVINEVINIYCFRSITNRKRDDLHINRAAYLNIFRNVPEILQTQHNRAEQSRTEHTPYKMHYYCNNNFSVWFFVLCCVLFILLIEFTVNQLFGLRHAIGIFQKWLTQSHQFDLFFLPFFIYFIIKLNTVHAMLNNIKLPVSTIEREKIEHTMRARTRSTQTRT